LQVGIWCATAWLTAKAALALRATAAMAIANFFIGLLLNIHQTKTGHSLEFAPETLRKTQASPATTGKDFNLSLALTEH
jgi:hypothetical protein